MAVQQGQLSPTDTTKNMTGFYNDAVVTTVASPGGLGKGKKVPGPPLDHITPPSRLHPHRYDIDHAENRIQI